MRKLSSFLFAFLSFKVICFGQEEVEVMDSFSEIAPVRFIPTDSLFLVKNGRKVKLDFKTKYQEVGQYPSVYPSLKGARMVSNDIHWYGDTIKLTVDGHQVEFVERKGKTVDYYLFSIECLMSTNYQQGYSMVIPYSTILDTKPEAIQFQLMIEIYKHRKKDWKKIRSLTEDVWIRREQLDGVLISEIGY